MPSTTTSRFIRASRAAVYAALIDADAIASWRFPDDMTCCVHEFAATVGGAFRVSLTYGDADRAGKSGSQTDTYHGTFADLVPDERVVETMEFETDDPAFRGEMTMTTTLTDAPGGTQIVIVHDGLPDAVSPADNETGTRMALDKLAALVEGA